MLRLIRWLIWGDAHSHKWEIIRQGAWMSSGGGKGAYYDCRCSSCGRIKMFKC